MCCRSYCGDYTRNVSVLNCIVVEYCLSETELLLAKLLLYVVICQVVVKDAVNDSIESTSEWKELLLVDSEKVPLFQHDISGLSPRTSYEIEITARNEVGWSKSNKRFIFTTSGSKYFNQCLVLYTVISLMNNSGSNNN